MTPGVDPIHYHLLAALLFTIGFLGVILRRNLLVVLMGIEIVLNGVNLTFATFARQQGNEAGQVAALFVLAIAAAEAAVALSLIVLVFRQRGTIDADKLNLLKG